MTRRCEHCKAELRKIANQERSESRWPHRWAVSLKWPPGYQEALTKVMGAARLRLARDPHDRIERCVVLAADGMLVDANLRRKLRVQYPHTRERAGFLLVWINGLEAPLLTQERRHV